MVSHSDRIRCRITGTEYIRFINLRKNNEIELQNIEVIEDGIIITINVRNFKRLGPLIRKTHVRIHILNRRGPVFFFYRHKKRIWFLTGILFLAVFIWYMSSFIWKIDISGNEKYTDALILQYLRGMGIDTGSKKESLSTDNIEENLRIAYNEITWVSASVKGTKLQIDIREGNTEIANGNNNRETEQAADIKAGRDGVITSMVVRRGTPVVKNGDSIRAGDLLVEGAVYIYNDDMTVKTMNRVRADADIIGNYEIDYDKKYMRKYTEKSYLEKKNTRMDIELFGFKIALPDFFHYQEQCEKWEWQKQLRLADNFYLPVVFCYTESIPYKIIQEKYSDTQLNEMAETDFNNYLDELEKKGVQIISNSVTISLDTHGAHMVGKLMLNGPIAESVMGD